MLAALADGQGRRVTPDEAADVWRSLAAHESGHSSQAATKYSSLSVIHS
jgi:hypothetical protein